MFPSTQQKSIVELMDHIFKNENKNVILSRENRIDFSTRFKQETPSCPPTTNKQPSSIATPTLARHEFVGAVSLLHWFDWGPNLNEKVKINRSFLFYRSTLFQLDGDWVSLKLHWWYEAVQKKFAVFLFLEIFPFCNKRMFIVLYN